MMINHLLISRMILPILLLESFDFNEHCSLNKIQVHSFLVHLCEDFFTEDSVFTKSNRPGLFNWPSDFVWPSGQVEPHYFVDLNPNPKIQPPVRRSDSELNVAEVS